MAEVGRYRYEHLFIDNASTDGTVKILRRLAAADPNVKVIVNTRNFGHITSPMHALSQARGDAVIGAVADFQDPPELIPARSDRRFRRLQRTNVRAFPTDKEVIEREGCFGVAALRPEKTSKIDTATQRTPSRRLRGRLIGHGGSATLS